MKTQIRGIISFYPENKRKIQIVVRDETGENYLSIEYPQGKPLNRGQVILFIAEKMKIPVSDVSIPSHLSGFFSKEQEEREKVKKND